MEFNPIGLKLAIIDRSFKKRMDDYAKELGLTSVQLRVLAEINRMEKSNPRREINQKDLEKKERVSHPTMSSIIKHLQNKGFIECTVSKMDRRYKKITTTERSANISEQMSRYDMEVFDAVCGDMPEEQKREFLRSVDIIIKNLTQNTKPLK